MELCKTLDGIDWQEIRQLLAALEQSSLTELTLEVKDFRLVLRKGSATTVTATAQPPVEAHAPEATPEPLALPSSKQRRGLPVPSHWIEIKAPMVGTFYAASAPGESDFVRLGERVQKGQTLCIIEAMKLMNELEAEGAGRVVEILVQNSQPVEFGQVLMRIDPEG